MDGQHETRPVPDPTSLTDTLVLREIAHLRELMDEKFRGVQTQFTAIKEETAKVSALNQTALEAALQSAKELVLAQTESSKESIAKSETATSKETDSLSRRFDDIKDQVKINSGRSSGFSDSFGWIIAVIMAALAAIALFRHQ
jgi:hypothetical protein